MILSCLNSKCRHVCDRWCPTMAVCQNFRACTPEIFVSHVLLDVFQSHVSPDVLAFPLPTYYILSHDTITE